MNISSVSQSNAAYSASSVTGNSNLQNTKTLAEILKGLGGKEDSLSLSSESLIRSKMPPPQEIDFTGMSDEDLTAFLQEMQKKTGFIPGVETGTNASDLTADQLQSARAFLEDMSSRLGDMQGMGRMQGMPPRPPMTDIQNLSNDDLKSILQSIQAETGSIPGIESSESIDVSALTDEQLQSARDALTEMMQARMEKMIQSTLVSQAVSAYEASGSQLL